jgi:acetolactate synthase-1/2/3 large subunit
MIDLLRRETVRAACILRSARAPSILVAPGARAVMDLVSALAHRLGAAVMTTPDAKAMFPETSLYAGGVFSFGSTCRAQAIAEATDVVLVLTGNLGEFASQGGTAFSGAASIHVTDDPMDLPIELPIAVALIGDVAAIVGALVGELASDPPRDRWFGGLQWPVAPPPVTDRASARAMAPTEAIAAIGAALPRCARLAVDVCSAALHVLHDLALGPETRVWMQLERSACMGTALSVGLGLRLASGVPTLVLTGDWGLQMAAAEMHTVTSLALGQFVIVVFSNNGGALIRSGVRAQRLTVPSDMHSWASPQFAAIACGYGIRAMTIRTAVGLRRAVAAATKWPHPVLIDAIVDPNAHIPGAQDRYGDLDASARAK